jgi:hypothetical protein
MREWNICGAVLTSGISDVLVYGTLIYSETELNLFISSHLILKEMQWV